MDGVLVSADNYTRLKEAKGLRTGRSVYLKTLSNESHCKIYFKNGAVEARFTVAGSIIHRGNLGQS